MRSVLLQPPVVGANVYQRSLPSDAWPPEPAVMPPRLRRATRARVRQHLAGRACALAALRDAGCVAPHVEARDDGAPRWPDGYVGSITHTASFASAAVASTSALRSIGIDCEELLGDDALADVEPLLLADGEARWVEGDRRRERATLLFSAKESLYKCLAPLAGVFFELADARVEEIDDARGVWRARLLVDLPGFARGSVHEGRFAVADGMVHTAMELEW